MQKEWLVQLIALGIFFLDSIIHVGHEGISLSQHIGIDFLFLLYHLLLFLMVNYVLIPRFFYPKKYLLFFTLLFASIVLFSVVEEGFIEKILAPKTKGVNDVNWQSIYWFFGEILIPLLTFVSIKLVFDNFAQRQKLQEIEEHKLRTELKLLKSQIQPHILFNSLNNLYHFALKKSEEVPELILKLSNVLRYVVYEATAEKVPLKDELSFLLDYIYLQEVQYKGRGKIKYEIPLEEVSPSSMITPFLLIPFVENSFKHSFGTKINEVLVNIKIAMKEQDVFLQVENNFEKEEGKREDLISGGVGLENVKKRLSLLYPNCHQLMIKTSEEKYSVHLNLKLS